MILGRRRRIELAIRALLESVLVTTTMTMLLLLLGRLFLVVRGRVVLCLCLLLCLLFTFPLSGGTRVVCVLGGVRVRGSGRTAVFVVVFMPDMVCCLSGLFGNHQCVLTHGALWGLGRALVERRRPPTLTAPREGMTVRVVCVSHAES